ncbi:hypothetical protein A2331_04980 [Candidatus Falkowbacteria bacterium RIFOXYB2_FULL_34_18]|uniref:Uncharacterized protein n=1 Tax=Candidatus Falkowbacteria bacterium RIFOXYD2_FULL_34_120 TaxID=1798007 RepID=A0A1F5TN88_9BACT|nr:MAG: hypothetical protein A2500_07270 [Candidatus Falkowbacteria bacterium RIFOXYC12_FULL_34_55]OGF28701.1 MAG: hypothetical protein A2331_04980 [Candidatus Falkowbacteria bacterium RIFOXYB2_FULL_34_18]OGF38066.1 MAG: hypothetical protein A2466_04160 [Candidatus Falkowbacteria bacterium RIFOXYC2_FULL_34_220]OGF38320.1 MAG: hypothetical protein A2515_06190 [Candidatus Falkowbacteria bacterium RIFOXYD12_FULL_34_57]OGF40307.1 MAG: hypothetical protein A2531_00450 [Candidatus Falkowbacteria bact
MTTTATKETKKTDQKKFFVDFSIMKDQMAGKQLTVCPIKGCGGEKKEGHIVCSKCNSYYSRQAVLRAQKAQNDRLNGKNFSYMSKLALDRFRAGKNMGQVFGSIVNEFKDLACADALKPAIEDGYLRYLVVYAFEMEKSGIDAGVIEEWLGGLGSRRDQGVKILNALLLAEDYAYKAPDVFHAVFKKGEYKSGMEDIINEIKNNSEAEVSDQDFWWAIDYLRSEHVAAEQKRFDALISSSEKYIRDNGLRHPFQMASDFQPEGWEGDDQHGIRSRAFFNAIENLGMKADLDKLNAEADAKKKADAQDRLRRMASGKREDRRGGNGGNPDLREKLARVKLQ